MRPYPLFCHLANNFLNCISDHLTFDEVQESTKGNRHFPLTLSICTGCPAPSHTLNALTLHLPFLASLAASVFQIKSHLLQKAFLNLPSSSSPF